MPFLRGTTPIWGTQDLPGRFKEWKACLVEIRQTAHKLETNARANLNTFLYILSYLHLFFHCFYSKSLRDFIKII